jgi:hypothetical protein
MALRRPGVRIPLGPLTQVNQASQLDHQTGASTGCLILLQQDIKPEQE